jgi:hypothetical protein
MDPKEIEDRLYAIRKGAEALEAMKQLSGSFARPRKFWQRRLKANHSNSGLTTTANAPPPSHAALLFTASEMPKASEVFLLTDGIS